MGVNAVFAQEELAFKDSKVAPSNPYEPLSTGLVRASTSSTTLKARLESLRGAGSVHPSTRPPGQSQAASTHPQSSPRESLSFGTVSGEEGPAPTTPALTVAVETLAPDLEEVEQQQSDAPTSTTDPHQPLETPSPTVSSFAHYSEDAQAVEISDHHTPSRAPSIRTARDTLRSSFSRIKNISKASLRAPSKVSKASKRALSHITARSRRSSKPPSDVAIQDTDTYFDDPNPFRTSSTLSQDSEPPAIITQTERLTEEPEPLEPEPEQAPDPSRASPTSSRAPSTVTNVRRSSIRNSISKFGTAVRQSSRVSFKALSRISSSGRSQSIASHQEPFLESITSTPAPAPALASTRPPSATDAFFPASPDFPPPRSRTSSRQPQRPPSLVPVPTPQTSVPEVISPHDLTASPSVYPSEFDSPAATTLPPPSRRQSWWFSPTQVFSPTSLPPDTEQAFSPPSAPRSPPKELAPEVDETPEQVSEQPVPSRTPTTKSKSSRSLPHRASSSQVTAPPPSAYRQTSAPSAVPTHRSEKSASHTNQVPPPSSAHSRVPSVTARSSESILFPRDSPFGESQPLAQSSLPPTRVPSRAPSQNPIPIPSAFPTPAPSVQSTQSRRTSATRTQSRAASRLASRKTSHRTITRLPSIISSRASKSNLTAGSATEAPEKVASTVTDSPVPPIAITITVPPTPSGSAQSSPVSSRGTSRKSRSRSNTHVTSAKPSLRSLTRIPLSALSSKQDLRTHLSASSHHPSKRPSRATVRTQSTVPQASRPPPSPPAPPPPSPPAEQPPSPPAPPPSDSHTPSRKQSFLSRFSPSRKTSSSHIFQPSRQPSRHFAPHERTTLPEQILESEIPPEILAQMPFNDDGTHIDAGMEEDYDGFNWFANRPPKPEPKAPETVSPPYVPMPGVVEQNEAFIYALQAAPNVLYANYKQYGQLGVLGWCAEFSELIDHLKNLGFDGNMFVNTRTQALATCQDLLKLRLDIKMQIIIMFLSSQVARLRRFLDGEGQYDDYPTPEFPLDMTRNYG